MLDRLKVVETRRWGVSTLGVAPIALVLLASVACSHDASEPSASSSAPTAGAPTATEPPSPTTTTPTATALSVSALFTNDTGENVTLLLEVADTPDERASGLMFRESLPEDAGMLFDFQADVQAGFWMRNTLIPLSIAFISGDGEILHIEDMQPMTEDLHVSPSPYRYTIEVNQGWYSDNGIDVGDTVELPAG